MTKSVNQLNSLQKIFSIIAGALLIGFAWRVRGNHGFGSMWGMFTVTTTILLLVYALYGKKKTMNYEMIPIAVILAGITTGGWGTLNSQMNGYLSSSWNFQGEEVDRLLEISPYSGLAIMLLLGFGWFPLFAIALGSLFSKKKYEFKDYVIFIGIYYATYFLANLSVSHYILSVINPQAVEGATLGLIDAGHDMTPMKAFITQLGSAAWAKKIPFCRNYFTSVQVISSAIGAFASSLGVGIVLKDKFNAIFSTLINLVCGIAITVADVPLILGSDRGFFAGVETPDFFATCAWSTWEFFTGFFLGLGIMLIIALLPKEYTNSEEYEYSPLFNNKKATLYFNSFITVFALFGIVLIRAFAFRLNELILDNETFEIVLTVLLSVILFFPINKKIKANMKNSNMPFKLLPYEFANKILPYYVGLIAILYFFLGEKARNTVFIIKSTGKLLTADGFSELWHGSYLWEHLIMSVAVIGFLVIYVLLFKYKKKKS